MEIKRTTRELKTLTFDVHMKEIVPTKEQNFTPFISYTAIINGEKVSCRFPKNVDIKPLENLFKEGIRRMKMTCKTSGIVPKYFYPRLYVEEIIEVEIED